MYMVALDHPSQLYAWSVSRVWWKPWRYNLRFYYMDTTKPRVVQGRWRIVTKDEVHRNLPLNGVKGRLKLFGLWKED